MFEGLLSRGYDLKTLQHARSILSSEFQEAVSELQEVLFPIRIPIEELVFGGGGKTEVVKRIENRFNQAGWVKHNFNLTKLVDGVATQAVSHEIDHVKKFENGILALEIEWNNKDPFFDRDLQSFRQLHSDGAISVGVIITRGASLQNGFKGKMIEFAQKRNISTIESLSKFYNPTASQKRAIKKSVEAGSSFEEAWANNFVSSKFGRSTTHWDKLIDRVNRGMGNPCPLVLIGIPLNVVVDE
jgi:hypothetical protein